MSSVIPGFEYDIFISYRHNDNRSGWVTDFVNALNEELAATIKDPLSIYFDKNPHDGLLETDSVDKSLEGKLKCLIFIPIISQTYCDPKSFAWQHEFCAFNRLSKHDSFGRDIKLINGNVTSRILPVKIHDVDAEDRIAIEKEIGAALRAIEFIFKSPGVNRPLLAHEEHPQDNLNNTFYRDQVNKVANAIKGIIQATKTPSNVNPQPARNEIKNEAPPRKSLSNKLIFGAVTLVVFLAVIFWYYSRQPETADNVNQNNVKEDKSLVVLPFEDMSPKKDQEWFSDGLTEELLNSLSSVEDLRLISRTTSFSFKNKGLSAKRIADSLGVAHILEGSIRKNDDQLRVTVQLIKASDDTHLWSHVYEYNIDSVFRIQGDISKNVASTLNVLLDAKTRENMYNAGTSNVEAYQEYLKGKAIYNESHLTGELERLSEANKFFEKAIQIYPNFAAAYYLHADIYSHSLLSETGIKAVANLSETEQHDRLMDDLNKALKFSDNANNKIGYTFARDFLSNNWTRLSSYPALKDSWRSGWEMILVLIDPEFVTHHYLKAVQADPFADLDRYCAALGYTHMGQLDSALNLYANDYSKSHLSSWGRSVLHFRNRNYSAALEEARHVENLESYRILLTLLNGQIKNRTELDRALRKQPLFDPYGYSSIVLYNALGEYSRADSVAALVDKRVIGFCSLGYNVMNFGLHFHLSATPNFATRLREMGIDVEAYEKKNYVKIPVVKIPE